MALPLDKIADLLLMSLTPDECASLAHLLVTKVPGAAAETSGACGKEHPVTPTLRCNKPRNHPGSHAADSQKDGCPVIVLWAFGREWAFSRTGAQNQ